MTVKKLLCAVFLAVLTSFLFSPWVAADSVSVTCNDQNELDKGFNCRSRYKDSRCCCWCPDPTGAHAYGHVMDLGGVASDEDVHFVIKPGAGDARCVTTGYMYYSLDGRSWTCFWSQSGLRGWTAYGDTVHIADSFRYIRANTDGCSVDFCKVQIGGIIEKADTGTMPPAEIAPARREREKAPEKLTPEEKAKKDAWRKARAKAREDSRREAEEKARQKEDADDARRRVEDAKVLADEAGAARHAPTSYENAMQKMKSGEAKHETQNFAAAAVLYEEATGFFLKSVEETAKTQALPSGLAWRDGTTISLKDGAEMVLIPKGEFIMGSPSGEGDRDEHPPHRVFIDSFYLDKYEVTNGQYRKFLLATGRGPSPDATAEGPEKDDHPVVGVNWEDANAYATWAGKRLPTEAEWEYACRAGTTTAYHVGDSITHDHANYSGREGADTWEQTAPAGSFPANAWGLCDMHGNVAEWCADWYDRDYYRNSTIFNPAGPGDGDSHVVRGGSWSGFPGDLRSAERAGLRAPESERSPLGFRCARDVK